MYISRGRFCRPFPSSPVHLRDDLLKHGAEAGQDNGQDAQKPEDVVPGENHHVLLFPFCCTPAKRSDQTDQDSGNEVKGHRKDGTLFIHASNWDESRLDKILHRGQKPMVY